jgi:hypothetical protein
VCVVWVLYPLFLLNIKDTQLSYMLEKIKGSHMGEGILLDNVLENTNA